MIDRLRAWLASLFGRAQTTDGADETAGADETRPAQSRCAICGTAVESADGSCPLCGATQFTTDSESDDRQPSASREETRQDGTDEAAERLSELRNRE